MIEGRLSSRAVLSLLGEDAAPFLQGIVTQDVAGDGVKFAALLTPQGKILFDFFLAPVEGGYLIDCDESAASALLKRLSIYKLRARIALATETGLTVFAGEAPGALVRFDDPRLAALPPRSIAPIADRRAIDADYAALCWSLGVPEFGRDFAGEEVFLLDVNYDALGAVSYKKGCFVGQEVTSRMKRKGEIRKRTLIVRGQALAKGAPVMAGGLAVGEMLAAGEGLGLAIIRIDRLSEAVAAGEPLTVAGGGIDIETPAYLGAA